MHTLLARMEHPHAGMDGAACSATPQQCAEDEQEPALASLIDSGNQPCCPGTVGPVLVAKLGAQQPLFCTDAREERRDHERREQQANPRTKGEAPPQRVDEQPQIARVADHTIDPAGDQRVPGLDGDQPAEPTAEHKDRPEP